MLKILAKLGLKDLLCHAADIEDTISKMQCFSRRINKRKSKNYPTPYYGEMSGLLLGYIESDEHFRKRIGERVKTPEVKK